MAVATPDAYWSMDAASGNESDSTVGARTLTDTGSCGTTTGKLNGARTFNGTSQYFTRASDSVLQAGDNAWTWAGWVKKTTGNATNLAVAGKSATGNYEWLLWQYVYEWLDR